MLDQLPTEAPSSPEDFIAFEFENAAELLFYLEPQMLEEDCEFRPHKWQLQELMNISRDKVYTAEHPLKMVMVAVNGSGKDRFVIALAVLFLTLCRVRHLTVITSSSGPQLTAQTENYIKYFAQKFNSRRGVDIFHIIKRYVYCKATGSEVRLFATDEAGKAEGYHPLDPDREMMIVVNEAKSIAPEIFEALTRCTGFNRWLEISSPGIAQGHLYDIYSASTTEHYPKIKQPTPGKWYGRKVTRAECPHLNHESSLQDLRILYGEGSALYKSMVFAEFSSEGYQIYITYENFKKCIENLPKESKWGVKRGGLDLAAGGDEISFRVWHGNTFLGSEQFRERDTTVTTAQLINIFRKFGFTKLTAHNIYADDGGVGRGIIDQLHRAGWVVSRVLAQSAAMYKKEYGNHSAEMWNFVARLYQECLLRPDTKDALFITQLTTRHYKRSEALGKIVSESKAEAKANGRKSPDRADADILAFTGLSIDDFIKGDRGAETKSEEESKRPGWRLPLTQEDLMREMDRLNYGDGMGLNFERLAGRAGMKWQHIAGSKVAALLSEYYDN